MILTGLISGRNVKGKTAIEIVKVAAIKSVILMKRTGALGKSHGGEQEEKTKSHHNFRFTLRSIDAARKGKNILCDRPEF